MAKIADLQVGLIKIKDGALTEFFSPSGSTVTVTNNSGSPTYIWVTSGGTCDLVRNRDSKNIYAGTGTNQAFVAVDDDPQSTESYTITGGTISGAMVRKV